VQSSSQRSGLDLVAARSGRLWLDPLCGGPIQSTIFHVEISAYRILLVSRVCSFWSSWFNSFPFSISSEVHSILASLAESPTS
jgi:hypothetical protein